MNTDKSDVFLVIGPKGCGKSTLFEALQSQTSSDDILFSTTIISCPTDMKHLYSSNKHFQTLTPSEFSTRIKSRNFLFIWRELNELQQVVPDTSDSVLVQQSIDIDGRTYRGIPALEVNTAIMKKQKLVINLSSAIKLPPANIELNRPDTTGQNYSLLHDAIRSLSKKANVKVVFVRSPRKVVEERLKNLGVYNDVEVERLVEQSIHSQSDKAQEQFERYLNKYNVPLVYVDNNSTLQEGARRLNKAICHEENSLGRTEVQNYMAQNKINELMEYLLNSLLVEKPENPTSYLILLLENLKKKKNNEILNKQDFETMFDLIDVTGKGYINIDQLAKCLENLRVSRRNVDEVKHTLKENNIVKVDKDNFYREVSKALNVLRETPYYAS
ncbi:EF-hand calcium-binding domain-containing protein [Acrasis kona]|uniref:EF-hand calcium-binding domain-containing protein n=1 Tax=Acrasis kona TaxID=1008807 RepID=A0AAW2Z4D5_9EUKA